MIIKRNKKGNLKFILDLPHLLNDTSFRPAQFLGIKKQGNPLSIY